MEGKLVIFSAPSGSGKTTLVHHLLTQQVLRLEFSISATSREPRSHEVNGRDYYFLSVNDFQEKISNNEFAEWEEVYAGHYYGTLKSEIERIWAAGNHVLFDVDVVGGLNLKKMYGDRALAIFVRPPSINELQRRLEKRGTESPDKLKYRLEKAKEELGYAPEFDKIIVNDQLEKAKQETIETVKAFLLP